MQLLILFFVLSILFSFLCSIWEAVLLSITPSYINRKVHENKKIGHDLLKFKEDIDRPLSAILTLNTIAHTVGAIGVGAQAAKIFGSGAHFLGLPTESVIAGFMTMAILILSEIIPKTIGANMWEKLAPFTVKSIKVLLVILVPFVWISQLITKNLKRDKDKSIFSRADIAAIAHASEESGVLDKSESDIIKNLLRFKEVMVKDIMTPRTVVVKADENMTLMEFHNQHQPLRFSRIPIYSESDDNISGIVLKDELLQHLVEDKDETLMKDIKRDVLAVLDGMPLPALYESLTTESAHIAIVVDEYGSLVGIVTMEDLIETLLGLEIVDEFDKEPDLQKFARDKWKTRAKELGLIE
ncbi:MAG: HlyC/CorC family transporter [Gammaproteobacteria bacterium]|nr:hemolysin family protein [Gammaproteobacteria bacterium]NNC98351.1 HlyC/CorC family transporter [Gammaproteobacteria bacterium]NNM13738.1 HlyC/CorC family transporter [Gammaproteobacteria bacterium]